jgi:CRISPR-associated protein Cmr4
MSNQQHTQQRSFQVFRTVGRAIDPIHVGTGGTRLGRVDNTIVRDPVTRIPKIPGSSLAGVHRAYAAMALEDARATDTERHYYPGDAGQGSLDNNGEGRINAVFGHKNFAGLAAFSDAQVVLFPVASREGPLWVTSPNALSFVGANVTVDDANQANQNKALRSGKKEPINLGWLQLEAESWSGLQSVKDALKNFGVRENLFKELRVIERLVLVSDKLFGHIVNSNLEVRTSVAINPATGAAEGGALFTYEAIPRGTVLAWDVTCRDPRHFKEHRDAPEVTSTQKVHDVVAKAHPLLAALGIGGMGTRGMGRLEVLFPVGGEQ